MKILPLLCVLGGAFADQVQERERASRKVEDTRESCTKDLILVIKNCPTADQDEKNDKNREVGCLGGCKMTHTFTFCIRSD